MGFNLSLGVSTAGKWQKCPASGLNLVFHESERRAITLYERLQDMKDGYFEFWLSNKIKHAKKKTFRG